ncbi:Transmembrane protein [Fulvia fulva]|uniref:Transmembrane protein n=1 Tax=Passalora fulva TaxID=5499 RepID=A0A9Q8LAK7_PASFU|nr:Transmembrane protein [Fulvia fulva]KAK4631951.1 Transmembrane protein [Fulvia fulva]KAK4632757.1 Transmembrane protein [Fulvia fulva]UJO13826.1 Transmembrane protein [Fulvia fulva]WPV11452.1 Transmembrane protein [Fulvia fulva]WPV25939.1 Transmembrane protein [Fulvia fulva]
MAAWQHMATAMMADGQQDQSGGTGQGFGRVVLIVTGVFALSAIILTFGSIFLQAKNYRKPLLQRHVIRIVILVPIFSAASWASLTSLRVAFWIDPLRDVYEAFTIYTFFQILVNFLGGERSLIIMMHGRAPVNHLWPVNHLFGKVDISDPHTFLQIKRGILQYAWIKPVLAIVTIACKATGTFREGIIAVNSGYFWTGLIYNVSICWSLYDLALFWVCMSDDLQPFRPMPKFLCIKGIIFASWWQGFLLSILVWIGLIPSLPQGGYTADNLAAAIQDALICFEMPFFAIWHWYAFSWKDYADRTISDARMPIRFALRDAFGPRDLIEDCKETFSGKKYEYRYFDAEDNVMAHEDSSSRQARMAEGMRYERNGRGKYWVPSPTEHRQPLLGRFSNARTMSPGGGKDRSTSRSKDYGTNHEPDEPELDTEEERLYQNARALEFGDWNYPVINTHYATREDRLADPNTISQTTNRRLLQPTSDQRQKRKSRIADIKKNVHQHDRPETSSSGSGEGSSEGGIVSKGKEKLSKAPVVGNLVRSESDDSQASKKSHSSQLVDLVVEDHQAEEVERVRARKEGGPGWNSIEQKHFVKTYPNEQEAEEVRQGFNPDEPERKIQDQNHTLTDPFTEGDGQDEPPMAVSDTPGRDQTGHEQPWEERTYDGSDDAQRKDVPSPDFEDERNAWGGDR